MIAQIDKDEIAMITFAVNPARNADGLANIGSAQLRAMVCAVDMHERLKADTPAFVKHCRLYDMSGSAGVRLQTGLEAKNHAGSPPDH
jgi:hypothetical protein